MGRSSKESVRRLYEIASKQQGYFTTKQAITAGYPDTVHSYHLKNGDWIRCRRGIYRLNRYPASDQGDLVVWALWSRGRDDQPQGVFSHQTALEIHGLLKRVGEGRYNMTVPPRFRKLNGIPDDIILHHEDLLPEYIEHREGFSLTTLAKTLADLERESGLDRFLPLEEAERMRGRQDVQEILRRAKG